MLEQVKKEDGEVSDGDRELEMQMHISNWRREREEREAERQRKEAAMEEIALKYARDIDIDSDDDIPIQRYTKPQLIYTIASDPNMPLNSHLTLGKNNKKKKKKKKKRPYWERNRADVGNTSRVATEPPSKMPRLVPGRTDIHDWLNNTPDPDLIQVPPDKFCILLTREELQRAIEDKDSYHWRSRVGYKWIVREKRDSSKCNELAATPNYKPIECSPLTEDKEEGTNTVAVEIAEPSQLPLTVFSYRHARHRSYRVRRLHLLPSLLPRSFSLLPSRSAHQDRHPNLSLNFNLKKKFIHLLGRDESLSDIDK